MSKQNLMNAYSMSQLGFYGKLPSVGDFVSRRLPQDFISSWDSWLQSSLAASQEHLGEQWLRSYLTSPLWRFALSSGLASTEAWVGIVMPSVDRVGRYFPLTIAMQVSTNRSLIQLFSEASDWFDDLETVALSALDNNLAVDVFDEMVQGISPFENHTETQKVSHYNANQSKERSAFYLEFETLGEQSESVFPNLTSLLLNAYLPMYSLWESVGADDIKPGFLVVNGLPPFTAYTGMITGQFNQTDWELTQQHVISSLPLVDLIETKTIKKPVSDKIEIPPNHNNKLDQNTPPFNSNAILATPEQRAKHSEWRSFSKTDTGKVRKINEDSILDRPDQGLWVVADGMGGHQAGDVASRKIIHTLNKLNFSDSLDLTIAEVRAALQLVNNELNEIAEQSFEQQMVGSTVVALLAGNKYFACLWAGDSRLYRLRNRQLLQVTLDHCTEQEDITDLLNLGSGSALKQNNVITRAVGAFDELELDYQVFEIQAGDIFLLSSDGLDKELSFQEIEQVLINNIYSDSVEILLEQVLLKGARDNVSVIVVEIN